ncbi:lactate/malate family dehydrogenase [Bacteroidetes bacterium endosymbiont of Geopemphigus sp.]|uniref:lactate/malate family dehydrogenase n=1 Tax=Bacteroidetes bacterium endosymbiont of Geopemphigus sp. TaxID=2047937 RepID=UPI000CD093CF|nr:hypothetical protein [Bacteroidetes bacterium endosymbiont of Geopemphigus sp.]
MSETADSQIIILTAGVRVSPGMSREDVLSINAEIVIFCTEKGKAQNELQKRIWNSWYP